MWRRGFVLVLMMSVALVPSPAHPQAQCKSGNVKCPNTVDRKIPASWLQCPDCPVPTTTVPTGGGPCSNCTLADRALQADVATSALTAGTANSAATLTGNISGAQVTSCPALCGSSGGGTSPSTAAPLLVRGTYGTENEVGVGFQETSQTPGWLARSGQFVTQPQARPLARNMVVAVGERYHPGGWPLCNGFTAIVTQAGTTGAEPPLDMGWVRKPTRKVRAGQLVYAGYAGAEAYGLQFRALTACKTGRNGRLTWPSAAGGTVTDGTCTFRAEPLAPIAFTDGTARFGQTWGADAYCGRAAAVLGTDAVNDVIARFTGNDNSNCKVGIDYPNSGEVPWYGSGADTGANWHACFAGGDPRSGSASDEYNTLWNPWGLRVGGGAHFAGGPALREPMVEPTLRLLAGGSLTVGREYCFTYAWEDERWALPTAAGLFEACVTPTAGMQTIEVTLPEDIHSGWPMSPDNVSKAQVRAWVYVGTRDYYCVYAGTIEKPPGAAGPGNDRLIIPNEDSIPENATCEVYNRNTRAVVAVGDPALKPAKWQPDLEVRTAANMVTPTVDNGRAYIVEGVGCDAQCNVCTRGYVPRGRTGTVEPNWLANPFALVFDNGVCWKPLPLVGHAMALGGPLRVVDPYRRGELPKIAQEITQDGWVLYDTTKPNPLLFPQVRFSRGGLTFYGADGATVLRSYTAAGMQ